MKSFRKTCSKCRIKKSADGFYRNKTKKDGLQNQCKNCHKQYNKQPENREKKKKYNKQYHKQWNEQNPNYDKQYYQENKKQVCARVKRYYQNNKEKIREQHNKYTKKRRKTDPIFKLKNNISRVINAALKKQNGGKNSPTWLKLPYTSQQLKEYLENQFENWMSWDNYGRVSSEKKMWNIDHIYPQSKLPYDSMDHPNFQKCWALENLRPLEVKENTKKSDSIV